MKSTAVISILITLLVNSKSEELSDVEVLPQEEFQGLLLENIGNVKLIKETRKFTFCFDLAEFYKSIKDDQTFRLKEIQNIIQTLNGTVETNGMNLQKLSGIIAKRLAELDDLTQTNDIRTRRKRFIEIPSVASFFGILDNDAGKKIQKDLEGILSSLRQLRDVQSYHFETIKVLSGNANNTLHSLVNITKDQNLQMMHSKIFNMVVRAEFDLIDIEEKIKSIHRVMVNKRMDSSIVAVTEFQKRLDDLNIPKDSLPFKNVLDFYNNIPTRSKMERKVLKIEMKIPIIEDLPRELYKIHRVPTRFGDKLILLEVEKQFVAFDTKSFMTFENVDRCYRSVDHRTRFCYPQSSLKSLTKSGNCLANTIRTQKIDFDTCSSMIKIVEYSQLTFIKRDGSAYFYYSQKDETIHVSCRGNEKKATLTSRSGILLIPFDCYVESEHELLLPTLEIDEIPVWQNESFNISFDKVEFQDYIKRLKSPSKLLKQLYTSAEDFQTNIRKEPIPPKPVINEGTFFKFELWTPVFVASALILTIMLFCFLSKIRECCLPSKNCYH